jgi:hypothetical protein
MIADIPHAFDSREMAGCGGEIAHGNRRCRHSHGAVQHGTGDHTDRENFRGAPRSIAAPSMTTSRPFSVSDAGCDGSLVRSYTNVSGENNLCDLALAASMLRQSNAMTNSEGRNCRIAVLALRRRPRIQMNWTRIPHIPSMITVATIPATIELPTMNRSANILLTPCAMMTTRAPAARCARTKNTPSQ